MNKEKVENLFGCFWCGIAIMGILMIMGLITYISFDANWMGGVVVAAVFLILIGIAICNIVSEYCMGDNCRDEWN